MKHGEIIVFKTSDYLLMISPCVIDDLLLSPPADVLENCARTRAERAIVESIRAEFARLNSLPHFDLLTKILCADAEDIQPNLLIARRIGNLALLSMKPLYVMKDSPINCLEGENFRAFVIGPEEHEAIISNVGGTEEEREIWRGAGALVQFKDEEKILEFTFSARGSNILTLNEVVDFISCCRAIGEHRRDSTPQFTGSLSQTSMKAQ